MHFRPLRSDNQEASSMEKAKPAVVYEMVRLDTDGETANSCEKTGISGCIKYSKANVTKLPKNKAIFVFQYCGLFI